MSEPVRVLQVVGGMSPGGIENFIMNLYENIDREKIQFDFIVHGRSENDYVEQIKSMGGKVYELPRLIRHPIKNLHQVKKIVKENKYPVVIRHSPNALVMPQLYVAKKAGAVTICHSHSSEDPQRIAHKLGQLFNKKGVDERLACSEKAGKWMYQDYSFIVIHNAISFQKFSFKEGDRARIREEFDFSDCKVYGHIGNFNEVKNHLYLIEIFAEIAKLDDDARFICVGEGHLRPQIEEKVKELGLTGKVFLPGTRRDVNAFMSALDVLIFPSIYEGLPLTLIEAQVAGLPGLLSDHITKDVIVTEGLFEMAPIEESPSLWAKKAVELAKITDRTCQRENLKKAGYDLEELTKWFEEYIKKLVQ